MPLAETQTRAMIPFTPAEYHQAAMACRAAAFRAEQDAKQQANSRVAQGFYDTSVGYRQLAAKFELASQTRHGMSGKS